MSCPYCSPIAGEAWIQTDDVIAVSHPAPFAAFHMVVAPRRHVAAFYDLDVGEQRQIWDVVGALRQRIAGRLPVTGFMVGFQDAVDGDSQSHAVVHLVPKLADAGATLPPEIDWVPLDS